MQDLEKLLDCWEQLGQRERLITLAFMYRLLNGQRMYGKLTPNKLRGRMEAAEEALDAAVYLACELQDGMDAALEKVEPKKPDAVWTQGKWLSPMKPLTQEEIQQTQVMNETKGWGGW